MMSLWDALRMNMMISYQELVRTFPKQSKYETFVEAKDPRWLIDRNNLRRAWRCEVQRHTQFYTLSFNEGWFPNGDPQVLANQCSQIADLDTVSEDELLVTKTIRSRK